MTDAPPPYAPRGAPRTDAEIHERLHLQATNAIQAYEDWRRIGAAFHARNAMENLGMTALGASLLMEAEDAVIAANSFLRQWQRRLAEQQSRENGEVGVDGQNTEVHPPPYTALDQPDVAVNQQQDANGPLPQRPLPTYQPKGRQRYRQ